jgi:hypothetical protein
MTHLGKFLLCRFFSYISGFAAAQQRQRSSSNNSSNAVTGYIIERIFRLAWLVIAYFVAGVL